MPAVLGDIFGDRGLRERFRIRPGGVLIDVEMSGPRLTLGEIDEALSALRGRLQRGASNDPTLDVRITTDDGEVEDFLLEPKR